MAKTTTTRLHSVTRRGERIDVVVDLTTIYFADVAEMRAFAEAPLQGGAAEIPLVRHVLNVDPEVATPEQFTVRDCTVDPRAMTVVIYDPDSMEEFDKVTGARMREDTPA